MMKIVLFALSMFLLTLPVSACRAEEPGAYTEKLTIKAQSGKEHKFQVEIAATPETVMKGLMFRSSMPEDSGMLFMFPQEQERNFWMRNTLIPLDIIYIRESGVIHHIHENAIPHDETPLPSSGAVKNVLELNGGVTAKLGIRPGDVVYLNPK